MIIKGIYVVGVLFVLVLSVLWAITGNTLFMSRYFYPKFEQVRRQAFEQFKAYRQDPTGPNVCPAMIEPNTIVTPFKMH
jgi:hypothetical protein